jgi:hypothetical protein
LGIWFLDGPEYYSPPGQQPRYLAYQNDVRRVVDSVAAQRHGGVLPLLYKHMVATSYQLALFRCARLRCAVHACCACHAIEHTRAGSTGRQATLLAARLTSKRPSCRALPAGMRWLRRSC